MKLNNKLEIVATDKRKRQKNVGNRQEDTIYDHVT